MLYCRQKQSSWQAWAVSKKQELQAKGEQLAAAKQAKAAAEGAAAHLRAAQQVFDETEAAYSAASRLLEDPPPKVRCKSF